MKLTSHRIFIAILLVISIQPWRVEASNCANTTVGFTPLNDLGSGTYNGQQGGLYAGGSNSRPTAHENAGVQLARSIRPLDTSGQPSANGKIVLLSIGMSNTTQEFSVFKSMADADLTKNPSLVIVDGAQGGMSAERITDPSSPTGMQFWNTVSQRLTNAGVSPAQVQIAWVKQANSGPTGAFPADVTRLQGDLTIIAQLLKDRFPNIRLAYYSSRIYAGYADTTLNPEPYAYQAGFAVKWMIDQQINGAPGLNYEPAQGVVRAPWLSWGPYLWADGMTPRSDGLTYACSDFQSDGTHPAPNGAREKVAQMLLNFFKTDSTARHWFRRSVNSIADFDGDGKTDLAVIRNSVWYILQSSNGAVRSQQFGHQDDGGMHGDFDGDGKTDLAVFRPPEFAWYIQNSSNNSINVTHLGFITDSFVPQDYDGDGRTDPAVFRRGPTGDPAHGYFYIVQSLNNTLRGQQWGLSNFVDAPMRGDFDGDGKADPTVFRQEGGDWYILQSSTNTLRVEHFGLPTGDSPIPRDYDGDGKTDVAVYRRSEGNWYIKQSADGSVRVQRWGISSDTMVPADYDGDSKADIAVYRFDQGTWYILQSSDGAIRIERFGLPNSDLPYPIL